MQFILESPVKLRILDPSPEELKTLESYLSYRNTSIAFQIKNLKKNRYLNYRFGDNWIADKLAELESQLVSKLLYTDSKGLYTLSGLSHDLSIRFNTPITGGITLPPYQPIPWQSKPNLDPYPYQIQAVNALAGNEDGVGVNPISHISLPTGSGKSLVVTFLLKRTGLPTIVVTPSTSIAKSIYEETVKAFGKKYVGMYGGGKKEVGKHFLICIGKSLTTVKDPELIEQFKKYQVFISDESHTLGAELFSEFSLNLLGHCPYRWFLSATQERNDGSDLLLSGIIGKQVYEMTIQDAMKQGYLAKLSTLIFDVQSTANYTGDNIIKVNQHHLYRNKEVLRLVTMCAAQAVNNNKPTLILIDEYAQEELLRNTMKIPYTFAHAGADVHKICQDFNDGKIMCVVGTSAVSVGTNFKPVQVTIAWKGSKAGTRVKQGAIGRSTRIDKKTGKTEAKIIDFRVVNIPMLKRHADMRIKFYEEVGEVTYAKTTSQLGDLS